MSPESAGNGGCQAFECVEISIALCQRKRTGLPPQPRLPQGSPLEQSATSAFQPVNRGITNNPVPSCAAFSSDMRLLAVGFENGTIQVSRLGYSFTAEPRLCRIFTFSHRPVV